MKLEFKQYISKRYGVSIQSLYKNTILIGQTIEVDTTDLLDSIDELDVLLRVKKYPLKIDTMDLELLTEQQKEKILCIKTMKSIGQN